MKKHMSKIMLFLACMVIVASTTTVYAYNNYDDEYVGQDFCQQTGVQASLNVVSWLLLIAKMMIPMIIIIFGSLDLYKVVISGDAGDVPKAARSLGYRIILGVFIFFLPTLTKAFLGYLLPQDYNTCAKCVLQPGSCKGYIFTSSNDHTENSDNNNNTNGTREDSGAQDVLDEANRVAEGFTGTSTESTGKDLEHEVNENSNFQRDGVIDTANTR
jgi:hypothetical protein